MTNDAASIPRLTATRAEALRRVDEGRVYTYWPMGGKPPQWMVSGVDGGFPEKGSRATFLWLRNQGLIRADLSTVHRTPYVLTSLGRATLDALTVAE